MLPRKWERRLGLEKCRTFSKKPLDSPPKVCGVLSNSPLGFIPSALATMKSQLSPSSRRNVYAVTGGHCLYCAVKIPYDRMTIDHVVPTSKGGSNSNPKNLAPACYKCNGEKGDSMDVISNLKDYTFLKLAVKYAKHVEEFKASQGVERIAKGREKVVPVFDEMQNSSLDVIKEFLRKRCRFYNNVWQVRDMCFQALNEISMEEKFFDQTLANVIAEAPVTKPVEILKQSGKGWPDGRNYPLATKVVPKKKPAPKLKIKVSSPAFFHKANPPFWFCGCA
jgi:hypothetical protein